MNNSNKIRAYHYLLRGLIMVAKGIYKMVYDDDPPKIIHLMDSEAEPQKTIEPTIKRVNGY